MGPIMTPMLKHIGKRRKARDWYLVCDQRVSLETMVACTSSPSQSRTP